MAIPRRLALNPISTSPITARTVPLQGLAQSILRRKALQQRQREFNAQQAQANADREQRQAQLEAQNDRIKQETRLRETEIKDRRERDIAARQDATARRAEQLAKEGRAEGRSVAAAGRAEETTGFTREKRKREAADRSAQATHGAWVNARRFRLEAEHDNLGRETDSESNAKRVQLAGEIGAIDAMAPSQFAAYRKEVERREAAARADFEERQRRVLQLLGGDRGGQPPPGPFDQGGVAPARREAIQAPTVAPPAPTPTGPRAPSAAAGEPGLLPSDSKELARRIAEVRRIRAREKSLTAGTFTERAERPRPQREPRAVEGEVDELELAVRAPQPPTPFIQRPKAIRRLNRDLNRLPFKREGAIERGIAAIGERTGTVERALKGEFDVQGFSPRRQAALNAANAKIQAKRDARISRFVREVEGGFDAKLTRSGFTSDADRAVAWQWKEQLRHLTDFVEVMDYRRKVEAVEAAGGSRTSVAIPGSLNQTIFGGALRKQIGPKDFRIDIEAVQAMRDVVAPWIETKDGGRIATALFGWKDPKATLAQIDAALQAHKANPTTANLGFFRGKRRPIDSPWVTVAVPVPLAAVDLVSRFSPLPIPELLKGEEQRQVQLGSAGTGLLVVEKVFETVALLGAGRAAVGFGKLGEAVVHKGLAARMVTRFGEPLARRMTTSGTLALLGIIPAPLEKGLGLRPDQTWGGALAEGGIGGATGGLFGWVAAAPISATSYKQLVIESGKRALKAAPIGALREVATAFAEGRAVDRTKVGKEALQTALTAGVFTFMGGIRSVQADQARLGKMADSLAKTAVRDLPKAAQPAAFKRIRAEIRRRAEPQLRATRAALAKMTDAERVGLGFPGKGSRVTIEAITDTRTGKPVQGEVVRSDVVGRNVRVAVRTTDGKVITVPIANVAPLVQAEVAAPTTALAPTGKAPTAPPKPPTGPVQPSIAPKAPSVVQRPSGREIVRPTAPTAPPAAPGAVPAAPGAPVASVVKAPKAVAKPKAPAVPEPTAPPPKAVAELKAVEPKAVEPFPPATPNTFKTPKAAQAWITRQLKADPKAQLAVEPEGDGFKVVDTSGKPPAKVEVLPEAGPEAEPTPEQVATTEAVAALEAAVVQGRQGTTDTPIAQRSPGEVARFPGTDVGQQDAEQVSASVNRDRKVRSDKGPLTAVEKVGDEQVVQEIPKKGNTLKKVDDTAKPFSERFADAVATDEPAAPGLGKGGFAGTRRRRVRTTLVEALPTKESRERFVAAYGLGRRNLFGSGGRLQRTAKTIAHEFRQFPTLPKTQTYNILGEDTEVSFARVENELRLGKGDFSRSQREAIQAFHKPAAELATGDPTVKGTELLEKFQKVLFKDLAHEARRRKAAGSETSMTWGLTPDEVLAIEATFDKDVAKHPELQKALDARRRINKEMVDEAVRLGIIPEGAVYELDAKGNRVRMSNEDYFHHQVIMHAQLADQARTPGRFGRKPHPGYAFKRSLDTGADINSSYPEVELFHTTRMLYDIKKFHRAQTIVEDQNIKSQLVAEAKQQGGDVTWEDLIPDGYEVYRLDPRRIFFHARSVPEHIFESIIAEDRGLTPADKALVRDALHVGGNHKEFVIPTAVVATFDAYSKPLTKGIPGLVRKGVGLWKMLKLFGPRSAIGYFTRNPFGDFDLTFSALGTGAVTPPNVLRAVKRLIPFFRGKAAHPDVMHAWEQEVLQSTLTQEELPALREADLFVGSNFMKDILGFPASAAKRAGRFVVKANVFRENIFRLAAFQFMLKQYRAGDFSNMGVSNRAAVLALKTPEQRAGKVAREAVLDYGALTKVGQDIRTNLRPFHSWDEGIFRHYGGLIKNAFAESVTAGQAARKVGRGTAVAAKRVLFKALGYYVKALFLTTLSTLWNRLMFPETEQDLPDYARARGHVIAQLPGTDPFTVPAPGALSDVMEWLGLTGIANRIGPELLAEAWGLVGDEVAIRDRMGISEKDFTAESDIKDVPPAVVNRFISGLTPILKDPAEIVTGVKTFPAVLEGRKERGTLGRRTALGIARTLSLENELAYLTRVVPGLIGVEPSRGYAESWLRALPIRKDDIDQMAYFKIRDRMYTFLEDRGVPSGAGRNESERSFAYYQLKKALQYRDTTAQAYWTQRVIVTGGTQEGWQASLGWTEPLKPVPRALRKDFLDGLTEREQRWLKRAARYHTNAWHTRAITGLPPAPKPPRRGRSLRSFD